MSALVYVHQTVIPAALALLPPKMDSREARAMMIAVGLQESRFEHRRQIGGPAKSFWQFEVVGVRGVRSLVFKNAMAAAQAKAILARIGYKDATAEERHTAIEHNDILAALFARRLLWSHPHRLPRRVEADYAWDYYLWCWRPGKPHKETWQAFYSKAWGLV